MPSLHRQSSPRGTVIGGVIFVALGSWALGMLPAGVNAQQASQSTVTAPPGNASASGSVIPQIRSLPTAPPPAISAPPITKVASPIASYAPAVDPLPPRSSLRNQLPLSGRPVLPPPQTPLAAVRPATYVEPATVARGATPLDGNTPSATSSVEHPLAAAVARARTSLEAMAKIQDYSATLVKRERIDGALGEHQYLFVKVRHQPFSVYIYFLAPGDLKGQESIYVAGRNEGNLLAHPNGLKGRLLGTVSLKPTGMLAMAGNRYPITELGVKRLVERLIEVGEHDMKYGECAVKIMPGAKINGRDCTCYEVNHPLPRKEFIFHVARIYLDTEFNLPIRYEAYEWPSEKGGEPVLIEEYTYLNLKLNNGFSDQDFDVANPKYQFQ